jgi:hypothetical protein
MNRLEEVRALVMARRLADDALADAVREWIADGLDRAALADELGIDRTTLYRRYVWTTRGRQGRPKAGESGPLTGPSADAADNVGGQVDDLAS